jgi:hypothetical protein
MMSRNARNLVALAISAELVAACSSHTGGARQPPLAAIPNITSSGQISRPLDKYIPTVEDVEQYDKALYMLTDRCMSSFGLSAQPITISGLEKAAAKVKVATALYGYFDTAADPKAGYDRISDDSDDSRILEKTNTATVHSVEYGEDSTRQPVTTYNGKAVPSGGCRGVAKRQLGADEPSPFAYTVPGQPPSVPQSDSRLKSANGRWSKCMSEKGFKYSTPVDAYLDPRWAPPRGASDAQFKAFKHSPEEVATAQADISCKISTNYMGTMVALEAAYDDEYIASNGSMLSQSLTQLMKLRAKMAQVIASGGNS